jgi:drug/metabolite transporter (DMT)-like permease
VRDTKVKAKYRGILFIVISAFCFCCMSACVRLAGDVPAVQKSFFRNLVAMLVALLLLVREGGGFRPAKRENLKYLLARSVFGTIGILCNFYAVDHLLLSDASMLNKMSPFFAVVVSYFLLKEKLTPVQIVSLLGAFGGALLIIKPTFSNLDLIPSLIGLLGGFGAGMAYSFVRLLGKRGEHGTYIVFFFSSFSCLVALPYVLIVHAPMSPAQIAWLLGAGLCAAGGQFSVTAAYCCAPAREISIYDYSQVIFSTILGFFLFGDVPDALSFLGYLIVCGMAALSFWHNNRDRQRLRDGA